LKANPGAWRLQLRSGRSSELYDVVGLVEKFQNAMFICVPELCNLKFIQAIDFSMVILCILLDNDVVCTITYG
jgi:hypothetical protein